MDLDALFFYIVINTFYMLLCVDSVDRFFGWNLHGKCMIISIICQECFFAVYGYKTHTEISVHKKSIERN